MEVIHVWTLKERSILVIVVPNICVPYMCNDGRAATALGPSCFRVFGGVVLFATPASRLNQVINVLSSSLSIVLMSSGPSAASQQHPHLKAYKYL